MGTTMKRYAITTRDGHAFEFIAAGHDEAINRTTLEGRYRRPLTLTCLTTNEAIIIDGLLTPAIVALFRRTSAYRG
jgi:hypothetical protein